MTVAALMTVALMIPAVGCSLLSSAKDKPKPATTGANVGAAGASVAAADASVAAAKPSESAPAVATTSEVSAAPAAEPTSDALIAHGSHLEAPHRTVAHIVASVDGEPITAHDVEQFSAAVGHPVNAEDIADNEEAKAALKALISQKLLEKEIDRYSSKIDEEQVDSYMEVVRRDKHLTPEQFKAALAQSGVTMEDFRKHARQELEKEVMIRQQVRERVEISDSDIKAYYDEHKADFTVKSERLRIAQILIGVPQNATPQQVAVLQAKAEKIRKSAVAGVDFSDLARKYSDDVSKNNGGELGWFGPQDIMDQVYSAVKNLKPGDVAPVVHTNHGFHVLKLEDHQVPGVRPLEEVKGEIRNQLINERANAQLQSWVETDLVKQHDVETFY
jgi:peptidyl-prolyl cis-trans isomerase SurA